MIQSRSFLLRAGCTRPRCHIGRRALSNSLKAAPQVHVEGSSPANVTVVDSVQSARRVVEILKSSVGVRRYFGCDTEVSGIDLARQSPVGAGRVICCSIFTPGVDFGAGENVWVDAMVPGTLEIFRDFFEADNVLKIWHNYSFDRHVLFNDPFRINVRGLGGDTMHMARLYDTSRLVDGGGYSLEALSSDFTHHHKTPMSSLFAKPRLKKDGTPSKVMEIPPVEVLQCDASTKRDWIAYSCLDAESTYELYAALRAELERIDWRLDFRGESQGTLFDFYQKYLVPFGELLTDMERTGIQVVGPDEVQRIHSVAQNDIQELVATFRRWMANSGALYNEDDAGLINVGSAVQKQHVLFAHRGVLRPDQSLVDNLNSRLASIGDRLRREKRKREREKLGREVDAIHKKLSVVNKPKLASVQVPNTEGYIEPGKKRPKKTRELKIRGMGMPSPKYTKSGWPATDAASLRKMAGSPTSNPAIYGDAFAALGGGRAGHNACVAIDALCSANSIETMITHFIQPLEEMPDEDGRLHTSINLNTETGRLSSRRPNLQNQPALEKDRYKIRDMFVAREGCTLIVADYGQLELRILAHLTKCKSMIEAFELGGDFHSRTALGMYPHIQDALAGGEVLLEWGEPGPPPTPLIKDVFASERRKAKVLNFSIAYGKTAHGLAKDWGVERLEAQQTVDAWYADRPEVKNWQMRTIKGARRDGFVTTIWGRQRKLPDINSRDMRKRGHAERAAINTPIQGSAADVVMSAMLKVHRDTRLRELGWTMVLQVHDEIILEGPSESRDAALEIVIGLMENPFDDLELTVDMVVDAKSALSWYKAK